MHFQVYFRVYFWVQKNAIESGPRAKQEYLPVGEPFEEERDRRQRVRLRGVPREQRPQLGRARREEDAVRAERLLLLGGRPIFTFK